METASIVRDLPRISLGTGSCVLAVAIMSRASSRLQLCRAVILPQVTGMYTIHASAHLPHTPRRDRSIVQRRRAVPAGRVQLSLSGASREGPLPAPPRHSDNSDRGAVCAAPKFLPLTSQQRTQRIHSRTRGVVVCGPNRTGFPTRILLTRTHTLSHTN